MKMISKSICLLLLLVGFSSKQNLHAQSVKAEASVDNYKPLIGDQLQLKLTVEQRPGIKVTWPSFKDSLGGFEVMERSKIDTMSSPNNPLVSLRQIITLTVFDTGHFTIPPVKFLFIKGKSDTNLYSASTLAIPLQVYQPKVDTSKAIKDVKTVLDVPFTFKEALPYILGGLILVAIIWAIYYYIQKRKKKPVVAAPKAPPLPPHVIAMSELQRIEHEKIWQAGRYKLYHTLVTETIRTYIEARFGIAAMELTSDEILLHFRTGLISEEVKSKLTQLLKLSDMVKFAKAEPIGNENELSMKNAYDFIKDTTAQVATEPEN
jgi:hypothetical protein